MNDLLFESLATILAVAANGLWISAAIGAIAWVVCRTLDARGPLSPATRHGIWTVALFSIAAAHIGLALSPATSRIGPIDIVPPDDPAAAVSVIDPHAVDPEAHSGAVGSHVAPPTVASEVEPGVDVAAADPAEFGSLDASSTRALEPDLLDDEDPVTAAVTHDGGVSSIAAATDGRAPSGAGFPGPEAAPPVAAQPSLNANSTRNAGNALGIGTVRVPDILARIAPWIVVLWIVAVVLNLSRLLISLFRVRLLKRAAVEVDLTGSAHAAVLASVGRPFTTRASAEVETPVAAGFAHPAVLLPEALCNQLPGSEIEPILLHEAAHLSRRDDWVLLVQRLVECFLFYNPIVLWISETMFKAREAACDDWVVTRTRNPVAYVSSIRSLLEVHLGSRPRMSVAPGLADHKGDLIERMRRVLDRSQLDTRTFSAQQVAVAATLILFFVSTVVAANAVVRFAFAQDARPGAYAEQFAGVGPLPPLPPVPPAPQPPPLPPVPAARQAPSPPAPESPATPPHAESVPTYNQPPTSPGLATAGYASAASPGFLTPTGSASARDARINGHDSGLGSDLSAASWIKLLEVAQTIQSDSDRGRVLQRASSRLPDDLRVYEAFIAAASTIRSSSEATRVLASLLRRSERTHLPYRAIVDAAVTIRSSSERASLLVEVIRVAPQDGALDQQLDRAISAIESSSERERALQAMARR